MPQSTDSEIPTSNNKKENGNEQLSGNVRKPQVHFFYMQKHLIAKFYCFHCSDQ